MHKINIFKIAVCLVTLFTISNAFAGNPDRAGSAAGVQLLVNPWAKSSGLANANTASVTGAEAIFHNVAGLAFTKRTEILFAHTNYLSGSGTSINSFGFSQKVGESGVLGLSLSSMSFGDIEITTEDIPDGGIGKVTPTCSNLAFSYAKTFSNSIYGGFTLRLISERISNVGGQGISFDAGIRYVTGKQENVRLGIALKNVGPPMRYKGDGLATQVTLGDKELTVLQRADGFELPALVNIGGSYDFISAEEMHMLTVHANFTSNSFKKDQYMGGLEYSFKKRVALKLGYQVEEKNANLEIATNVWTGLAGGFSVMLPFGKNNSSFSLDYSYRDTQPFNGIHSIGARLNL